MSRESQLRHLAAWFTGVATQEAAHALFDAVFGLSAPRHAGVPHPDPEAIPNRLSWWDAPAVELSRTLVTSGRAPGQGNGRPARLDRDADRRGRLRRDQLDRERRHADAASALAAGGLAERRLDAAQTQVLLRLLDIALATRTAGPAHTRAPVAAAAHGVRLTLTPAPGAFTTVATVDGRLHLDGFTLSVTAAGHTAVRRPELVTA